jgi:upstream activation factor subunit UAF30
MPAKTKTTTATTATTVPAKRKAAKKKSSTVTASPVVVEAVPVVVETTPVVNTVVDEAVDVLPYQFIVDQMREQMNTLTGLTAQCHALKKSYTALEKVVVRELKTAHKASQRKKKRQGNRAPSGFVKPTTISTELANFLNRPKGEQMARTEVTREINAYIRKHSLQDPENGRKINPDGALSVLLKLTPQDELTYFNLQKYMSPHFQKAGAPPIV